MSLLVSWLASSLGLWVTAQFLPGFTVRDGFKGAITVAVILGLFQMLFSWLLFGVLAIGTLGLAVLLRPVAEWLITAILLVLTDAVSSTLKIRSFGLAFVGAVIVTVVSNLSSKLLHLAL